MNENSAKSWIEKAWHNLSTAQILYKADHYTDIIAVELHYTIEKSLKSFLAYENKKIPKTHDLIELYKITRHFVEFDEREIDLLIIAREKHIRESYPQFERGLPAREEVKEVLEFSENLFSDISKKLEIDIGDIK